MPIPPPPYTNVPYPLVEGLEGRTQDQIRRNFDEVGRYLGQNQNGKGVLGGPILVATSTTRPVKPYVGMVIYETDTGNISVWNGAAWLEVYAPVQAARATSSATTACPNAAYTKITLNQTIYNHGGGFSTANSNYTVPVAGLYALSGQVETTGGTLLNLAFFINAGVTVIDGQGRTNDSGQLGYYSIYDEINLNVNDVVDLRLQNLSGSGSATVGTPVNRGSPRFVIRRLGPTA